MAYSDKVKIYVGYKNYDFYYSYKENSTFLDLLEYFSYLFPELRICQCFGFQTKIYSSYSKKYLQIENDNLIYRYSKYLLNLELIDKNKRNCPHSDNYLIYSKTEIISLLEGEISKLKNNNNAQTEKINDLNKEKEEKEKEINNLNKEKKDQEKEINDLNKEKEEKEKEINDLNIEKKEKEKEINDLNRDKNLLEYAINGDVDKINLLNQLGVEGVNLKIKENLIQIDDTSKEIKGNQTNIKEKFIDFYDVIIHIDSIKDINKGWRIEFNEKTKEKYESFKNQKIIKIGIIGNSNKGKSFLLSKISKLPLPSGTSIRTEGLSIKYPELEKFKDRKIVLLDSAGLETPVLNLGNQNNFADEKVNELFREKSREKLIMNYFYKTI